MAPACCFNPFKIQKHGRKPVHKLRPVLPSMLRKLRLEIIPSSKGMKICNTCRIRLSKMPEIGGTTDSSSLENTQPRIGEDSTPTPQDFVDTNKTSKLGESRINKRRLAQEIYSRDKSETLQKTLASKVPHVEGETEEQGIEEAESTIIEKLKEAFRRTNDKNKKIQILTIFDHWSVTQIQKNFDAPKSMITLAKKTAAEFGILSTPKGSV